MALMLSKILFESMYEKIVCARVCSANASGAKKNQKKKINKINEMWATYN